MSKLLLSAQKEKLPRGQKEFISIIMLHWPDVINFIWKKFFVCFIWRFYWDVEILWFCSCYKVTLFYSHSLSFFESVLLTREKKFSQINTFLVIRDFYARGTAVEIWHRNNLHFSPLQKVANYNQLIWWETTTE